METFYYPVVVVENKEELDVVSTYCDEHKISFQFLDSDLNSYPAQMILFCDKEDFTLFLERV